MTSKVNAPFYRIVTFPNPVPGADFSLPIPGDGWWRLTSFVARIVTDANVGNRRLGIGANDGTNAFYLSVTNSNIVANATVDFSGFTSGESVSFTSALMNVGLPAEGLILPPGGRFFSRTDNIQLTDQWSRITLMVQEYPTGPINEFFPGPAIQSQERS